MLLELLRAAQHSRRVSLSAGTLITAACSGSEPATPAKGAAKDLSSPPSGGESSVIWVPGTLHPAAGSLTVDTPYADEKGKGGKGKGKRDKQAAKRRLDGAAGKGAGKSPKGPVTAWPAWDQDRKEFLQPSDVEIGKLLKENPPRINIVETDTDITIGRITYQKQDLADAADCGPGDKCWAVGLSNKPWPLKLYLCNHSDEPSHAAHDSPAHLFTKAQTSALRSVREAADK